VFSLFSFFFFLSANIFLEIYRPTVVFAQEMPQELAHIQGVPLNAGNNTMVYLNNAGYPPLGGEKALPEGVMGASGVPQMGGMAPMNIGGGMVGGVVPSGAAPGQVPVRTGGGGLCHFFFNTNVGCRYGEHCWFSHELPLQQQQQLQQQLQQQQQQQPSQTSN